MNADYWNMLDMKTEAEDTGKNIEDFRNSVTSPVNRFFRGFNGLATGFLCIVLFLSGCATVPTGAELKESLREKAEAYWKLRMEDRYGETYKMESGDGLPKYAEYLDRVRALKKFNIVSHSIKGVKVEGQKGVAEVEISYVLPPVTKPFKQVLPDEWVFERGRWRHRLFPN